MEFVVFVASNPTKEKLEDITIKAQKLSGMGRPCPRPRIVQAGGKGQPTGVSPKANFARGKASLFVSSPRLSQRKWHSSQPMSGNHFSFLPNS